MLPASAPPDSAFSRQPLHRLAVALAALAAILAQLVGARQLDSLLVCGRLLCCRLLLLRRHTRGLGSAIGLLHLRLAAESWMLLIAIEPDVAESRALLRSGFCAWPPSPCRFVFDVLRANSSGMHALPAAAAATDAAACFLPARLATRWVMRLGAALTPPSSSSLESMYDSSLPASSSSSSSSPSSFDSSELLEPLLPDAALNELNDAVAAVLAVARGGLGGGGGGGVRDVVALIAAELPTAARSALQICFTGNGGTPASWNCLASASTSSLSRSERWMLGRAVVPVAHAVEEGRHRRVPRRRRERLRLQRHRKSLAWDKIGKKCEIRLSQVEGKRTKSSVSRVGGVLRNPQSYLTQPQLRRRRF